jgi:hypothetical protein
MMPGMNVKIEKQGIDKLTIPSIRLQTASVEVLGCEGTPAVGGIVSFIILNFELERPDRQKG